MSLKVYYDLLSQPARALVIFLKQNNIPFESKTLNLMKKEHLKPEFAQINPLKKVPVIDHNGFVLTESVGILRYLSREFNVSDHWYPKESKAQAKVDEYLEWQHMNTRLHLVTYVRTKYMLPLMTKKPAPPKALKKLEKNVETCLDEIENIWLKDKSFLTSNQISIADIHGACEINQLKICGYDISKGRPKLTKWLENVSRETSPHYEEAHAKVNTLLFKSYFITINLLSKMYSIFKS